MKTAFSLLALIVTAGLAHAGGFGGPPPFTNGSPLISGVDGSYQATARGENLTGIFRFTYVNGRQSTAPEFSVDGSVLVDPYNDYVFFIQGTVYRGLVQANINTSLVSGVLDNGGAQIPNSAIGSTSSSNFVNIQAYVSGQFTGTMDQNSPNASFSGKGTVDTFTFQTTVTVISAATTTQAAVTQSVTTTVAGPIIAFKFKGVRNSQATSTSTTT